MPIAIHAVPSRLAAAAALLFIGLILLATPAAAQLTGGLEGKFVHHVFEYTPTGGPTKVVAEAWADRKTGLLWVRGQLSTDVLGRSLTLRSEGTDVGPPGDARALSPQSTVIQAPTWLKQGHIWARPADGIADTGLRLVLEPLCRRNCAVVAVEQYHLPGAEGMVGPQVKLAGVDRYPLEPGDRVTVYAPR